ncbi:hypothetical protein PG993_008709 [Apiospora rasikravindrae]|uniref:FAD-binding PCMH-type domain-containing protein n=1 Tax=Apiospora rasikravindrae TaxID=990691 RepID=A0ABR1SQV8_9PEZI
MHKTTLCLGLLAPFVRGVALDKSASLDDCLHAAEVPTNERNSTSWTQDTLPFNDRLHYTPVAVAVPTTVAHIQAAVSCAAKVGIKATPKGGGHSYASSGLGGEDGHLVIELDRMHNVTLDTKTNIATIQSGSRLGHVATELFKQGKRAFSHGTCPGVGVSGHSLHGGFGMSSHKYGLATDWMVGATVVLANSSLVHTSAAEHPDLFWALRGAGSNFGVVASYEFNTFPIPEEVTYFSMPFRWNLTTGFANLAKVEAYAKDFMPADLNMRLFSSGFSSQLEGLFYGNVSGLQAALAPLLNTTTPPLKIMQAVNTTWMEAFAHYANAPTDPTHPYSQQETFYSKSLELKDLSGDVGKSFTNYWFNSTSKNTRSWWFQLDIHGGKHSAVTNGDHSLSSYAHRDKLFLVQLYDRTYFGAYPKDGFPFLDKWVDATTAPLQKEDWGMYINYADSSLDRETAQRVYYGANLPRLQSLKAKYDPREVFYYPTSIAPAAAEL